MKKLMTLVLGAVMAFGAVSMYAGQDPPKKEKGTKKSTKAPKKKST